MRLLAFLLLPALSFAQVPHTFQNGDVADADKINENFQNLADRFPEQDESYEFVEQRTLEGGNVFTKLRLYEKASSSGFRVDRRPDDPSLAYEDWGQERSITRLERSTTLTFMFSHPKQISPTPQILIFPQPAQTVPHLNFGIKQAIATP